MQVASRRGVRPRSPPVRRAPGPARRRPRERGPGDRAAARAAAPSTPAAGGRCPICSTAPSSQHHFVVDVDDDGRAVLRFGDGEYGRAPRRRRPRRRLVPRRQRRRRQHRRRRARARRPCRRPRRPAGRPIAGGAQPAAGRAAASTPRRSSEVRQYAPAGVPRASSSARSPRPTTGAPALDARRRRRRGRQLPLDRQLVHGLRRHRPRATRTIVVTDARGGTRLSPAFSSGRARRASRATGWPATTSRSARPGTCRSTLALQLCARPGYFRGDVAQAVGRR